MGLKQCRQARDLIEQAREMDAMAAKMPEDSEKFGEGLDWTTNGLKVWTDESGVFDSKIDFWSIGREVEALWLEAESKLKLLPPDESEILRTTIKPREKAFANGSGFTGRVSLTPS